MSGPHRHLLLHHRSPLHGLAPEVKIVATFVFVLGVALTPRGAVWALAADAVAVVGLLALAGYGPGRVLGRAVVVAPFLAFAALVPFVADGETVAVGPLEVSREGLAAGGIIAARTLLGFGASLVLAGTTSVTDLIRGLSRLRVPPVMVSIAAFMFRYLDLVIEDMGRMRLAMTARAHDPRWLWQARPIGSAAGTLFVRSYERGERVNSAMLARGFTGRMPDTGDPSPPRSPGVLVAAGAVALIPAAGALMAALGVVGVVGG